MYGPSPRSTLFPYTTLFRSVAAAAGTAASRLPPTRASAATPAAGRRIIVRRCGGGGTGRHRRRAGRGPQADRKSTRLNSSHRCISYAVFCLKKKKDNKQATL